MIDFKPLKFGTTAISKTIERFTPLRNVSTSIQLDLGLTGSPGNISPRHFGARIKTDENYGSLNIELVFGRLGAKNK